MMDYLTLKPDTIASINYLHKHLFDNPSEKPTNVPKIKPDGTEVKSLTEVSALIGVDLKVASVYVMQDPDVSDEIKAQAHEVLYPGIFVPADDAYLPVLHKAFEIINNSEVVEEKQIRMVRTVAGVRRFRQKRGSIIVDDGEAPLDALTALPNDVRGYEKVGAKNGGVYYIGRENGEYVARDPLNGSVLHKSKNEEDTYKWLNQHVGGAGAEEGKKPTAASEILGRTATSTTRLVDEVEASRDEKLTADEAYQVNKLTNEQLDIYQRLKQRGIDHSTAYTVARNKKPGATPKKRKKA